MCWIYRLVGGARVHWVEWLVGCHGVDVGGDGRWRRRRMDQEEGDVVFTWRVPGCGKVRCNKVLIAEQRDVGGYVGCELEPGLDLVPP